MKCHKNYQNVTQRHEVSKCCWKKIAQCEVVTNLQFVKNTISEKCNNAKHNTMRYACMREWEDLQVEKFNQSLVNKHLVLIHQWEQQFNHLRDKEWECGGSVWLFIGTRGGWEWTCVSPLCYLGKVFPCCKLFSGP